eukprot:CAMPEP_0183404004 /NCGR_PEP_ID=MMETSP0370-20130417/14923_1 /TAXON_ID=268820 /ORGANISM="Peridinium aciculiferum, Strain PAER-2" /LENGTH=499 /DNA_ID=CAMNT_0025585817 /DNA_START=72 /DNA_END=1571 /DNA_ORIENTATION=+
MNHYSQDSTSADMEATQWCESDAWQGDSGMLWSGGAMSWSVEGSVAVAQPQPQNFCWVPVYMEPLEVPAYMVPEQQQAGPWGFFDQQPLMHMQQMHQVQPMLPMLPMLPMGQPQMPQTLSAQDLQQQPEQQAQRLPQDFLPVRTPSPDSCLGFAAAATASTTDSTDHLPVHDTHSWPSEEPAGAPSAIQQQQRKRRRPLRANAPTVPLRVAKAPGDVASGQEAAQASCTSVAQGSSAASASNLAAKLKGRVLEFAYDKEGSRQVQNALAEAHQEEGALLAAELRGHVQHAIESPHANYVLTCILVHLPSTSVSWIVDELHGAGVAVARHRYGCRVLCRLMEHHPVFNPSYAAGARLVDEVVEAAVQLSRNEFGRHTIIKLIEQGTDSRRAQVVAALLTDLTVQARHRNASYVVESALEHASDEDRGKLVRELTRKEDLLLLAQCQSGCHVIRSLLEPHCGCRRAVLRILEESADMLRNSKYGLLLLREQGLLLAHHGGT